MGQHRDQTEKIFLRETNKFLNQFRRQPPANPLQFSIPRAILAPCGMTVKVFVLGIEECIRIRTAECGEAAI